MNHKSETSATIYPAKVAEVLDPYNVVINKGREDGIKEGQRFLIYVTTDKDIIDPETGESLGILEISKGTGEVSHLQPKMATLSSDSKKQSASIFTAFVDLSTGFKDPKIGDKVRPI